MTGEDRQRGKNSTFVPGPASDTLVDRLEALRPWHDIVAVRRMLAAWSTEFTKTPIDELSSHDIAVQLDLIGQSLAPPDPDEMAMATFLMLGNVARGREATEYDLLRDSVKGWPPRTLRHYNQRYGRIHSLSQFVEHHVQYELDLAALVKGGRSVAAARRWLERHPGMHAGDASPPRRRRS